MTCPGPVSEPRKSRRKPRAFSLVVSDSVIARIGKRFLSFTIDVSLVIGGRWWGESKGLERGLSKDRVRPLDLGDPVLRRLSSHLAPALLRVGGTEADRLHYGFDRGASPSGASSPFVLRKGLWTGICSFAKEIGMGLLFTVGIGPETRNAWGEWDPRDAIRLMDYTARKGLSVEAWEYGNEANAFPFIYGPRRGISGRRYSEEFARFADILRARNAEALAVGPASAVWPLIGEPHPIIPALCRGPAAAKLGALSFHYYPQQSSRGALALRRAKEGTMLNARTLDGARRWIGAIKRLRDDGPARGAPIWITETGHALYGGQPGLSDTWISTPWWLDHLCLMAHEGADAVFRQSLAGGDYGLLDASTFEPRPDYHICFIWKKTIGTEVYRKPAVRGPDKRLRAWAMGGKKGGAWLILINLDRKRPAAVSVDRRILSLLVLEPEGEASSKKILLNGVTIGTDLEEAWGSKRARKKYGLARPPAKSGSKELILPPLACAFVRYRSGSTRGKTAFE